MPSGRPIKHPSWRVYRAIEEAKLKAKDFSLREDITVFYPYRRLDELTESLVKTLTDPSYEDPSFPIKECLDIFKDKTGRQLIEGLLLDGQAIQEVASFIDATSEMVMTYASLFYDTTVFSNRIEKLVYVKEGTAGQDQDAKSEVMEHGGEFFKAAQHIPSGKLKLDTLVADAASLAYIEMIKASKDDTKFMAAQGWGNLFVKFAAQLQKKGGGVSIKDFMVNLQSDEPPSEQLEDLDDNPNP